MKIIKIFSLCLLVLFYSCGDNDTPVATVAEVQEVATPTGATYTVDTAQSVIEWRATHRGGITPRWGTIKLKNGSISIMDSTHLTGGSFYINMYTLRVDSASVIEPGKTYADLQKHLHSDEFFYSDSFPEATFEITKVSPYDSTANPSGLMKSATNMVSGNLKLKDSTINITFPAKIIISDSTINVEAKFIIDRLKWGLNYRSQGDPQNWMIDKEIQMGIRLIAVKEEEEQ